MRAVVYSSPGEVTVTDVPDPALRADTDAVVQIELTGICGTDLHAISGQMPGVRARHRARPRVRRHGRRGRDARCTGCGWATPS